jgi:RimJ/RimL family protein N-acetyltransferase
VFGPILRGTLLTLRPPRKDELDIYMRWFEDPEVIRFQPGPGPYSPSQEEAWFNRVSEDPNAVQWAIEVDGKAIGMTGIGQISWLHRHGTTGITVGDTSYWRRGIASEAMALRTRYAFRELNLHKLKTAAFMENEGSRRALEKTGYRQVGIQRQEFFKGGRWHDVWEGELLREEWEKTQPGG